MYEQKHSNDEVAILTIMKSHMLMLEGLMVGNPHGLTLINFHRKITSKSLDENEILVMLELANNIKGDVFCENNSAILTDEKIDFLKFHYKIALSNKLIMSRSKQSTDESILVNNYVLHFTKNYEKYYQTKGE